MSTTLAGHALIACTLTIPRFGAWVADVLVDTDVAITGAVDLALEQRTWNGTVDRGGVELGRWSGRIVGGAGGLKGVLGPAPFADTNLRTVLTETLREAGELLADDSGDLSAVVHRWARVAAPAHHTVADVARAAGYAWRTLDSREVWMGVETWAAQQLGQDLDVMDVDPRVGRHELAGNAAIEVDPGRVVTLDGVAVRVGAVEHRLAGPELRTVVFEERAGDPANRLMAAVEAVVRRVMRHTDYFALYPCRVIAQNGDLLDLAPDSPTLQAPRGVRYASLPGVTLTVPADTRVLLAFENGDPSKPVALPAWDLGAVTSLAVAGGTHRAAREGHRVRVTLTADQIATIIAPSGTSGGACSGGPIDIDGTITEGVAVLRLP